MEEMISIMEIPEGAREAIVQVFLDNGFSHINLRSDGSVFMETRKGRGEEGIGSITEMPTGYVVRDGKGKVLQFVSRNSSVRE